MKNFEVGKELKELLSVSAVSYFVGDKIFPIVANEGTTFPFVVYRRNGYTPASNKDYRSEIVSVEIVCLSQNYKESVELANAVADSLINKETELIEDIKITNLSEDYSEDSFLQNIYLDVYLN